MSIIAQLVVARAENTQMASTKGQLDKLTNPHYEASPAMNANNLEFQLLPWRNACDGPLIRTSYRQISTDLMLFPSK